MIQVKKRKRKLNYSYQIHLDEEIRFRRTVQPSGSSEYYVDGKSMDRSQYEDKLGDFGILVQAKNFLVFQGDVESVASKSPKEITQWIEQISGSEEFKARYDDLLKEKGKAEETAIQTAQKKKSVSGGIF
jgi:structural maintenance of chromosome 1